MHFFHRSRHRSFSPAPHNDDSNGRNARRPLTSQRPTRDRHPRSPSPPGTSDDDVSEPSRSGRSYATSLVSELRRGQQRSHERMRDTKQLQQQRQKTSRTSASATTASASSASTRKPPSAHKGDDKIVLPVKKQPSLPEQVLPPLPPSAASSSASTVISNNNKNQSASSDVTKRTRRSEQPFLTYSAVVQGAPVPPPASSDVMPPLPAEPAPPRSPEMVRSALSNLPMPPTPPEQRRYVGKGPSPHR